MKKTIAFALLLFCSCILSAQEAVIPFKDNNGIMYIETIIDDYPEPLNFVFDTGASSTVLDEEIAEKMNVDSRGTTSATGASGSASYKLARAKKITIENVQLKGIPLILVDLKAISNRSPVEIHGIIGNDLLKKFVTRIDYEKKELTLFKKVSSIKNLDSYKQTNFVFDRGPIPQMEISIGLKNDKVFSGMVYIDTGARLSFLMNAPYAKENKIAEQIGKRINTKAESLTSSSAFIRGSIAKLEIEGFTFKEMPIDISLDKAGVAAQKGYMGILGSEVLRRFHMIFDYKNLKLYLKPNTLYANTFNFPRSRIRLIRKNDKVYVESVLSDKKYGEKINIEAGDELLKINNKSASLDYYISLLNDVSQDHMMLKIKKKSGEVKEVKLILKRLI